MRCMHEDCRQWFPCPIFIGNDVSFDISKIENNATDCPYCGRETGCNKENFRVLFEDGGFTGNKA